MFPGNRERNLDFDIYLLVQNQRKSLAAQEKPQAKSKLVNSIFTCVFVGKSKLDALNAF